ncbi:MAG: transglutaminase domain-containing protein [Candidatus Hydrogenedentota bacterium]|nr:MAG: transglutaminase domain-containing protein [Candidatus Hydrogenedentota bacterium]
MRIRLFLFLLIGTSLLFPGLGIRKVRAVETMRLVLLPPPWEKKPPARPPRRPPRRGRPERDSAGMRGNARRRTHGNSFGKFSYTVGFKQADRHPTDVDISFYLLSDYEGFQKVRIDEVKVYPDDPVISEIRTDTLGAKILHLVYKDFAPGENLIVNYSGFCSSTRKPLGDWKNLKIPSRKTDYPIEVRKYLEPGDEIEITETLREYAEKIATSDFYYEVIKAILKEMDGYPFSLNTDNQAFHYEFPPVYLRSALETYRDREAVCVEISRLAAALFRAKNIPARTVTVLDNSTTFNHTWVQVYINGAGWLDVDPLLGKFLPENKPLLVIDPDQNDVYETTFTTSPKTRLQVLKPEMLENLLKANLDWKPLPYGN